MATNNGYRPLGKEEQRFLCEYIAKLVPTARDQKGHPMSEVALYLMSMAMWRWTADGVGPGHKAKLDALKYDYTRLPSTRNARHLIGKGLPGARHEHVVPRMYLARLIRDEAMSTNEIERLLRRVCRATIITKEQDASVRPRNSMPKGWCWKDGDIYARYPAKLRRQLREPKQR